MKYQLVLQWPASSIKDYDAMIEVENALVENLSTASDVDGHDAGSGEVNIFIRTDDPKRAFNEVKAILGTRDFWIDARVAYREVAGSEYTILWPKSLTEFKVA
ncbi:MAG: ABC transporter [Verrucomicrobiota bacterium]